MLISVVPSFESCGVVPLPAARALGRVVFLRGDRGLAAFADRRLVVRFLRAASVFAEAWRARNSSIFFWISGSSLGSTGRASSLGSSELTRPFPHGAGPARLGTEPTIAASPTVAAMASTLPLSHRRIELPQFPRIISVSPASFRLRRLFTRFYALVRRPFTRSLLRRLGAFGLRGVV